MLKNNEKIYLLKYKNYDNKNPNIKFNSFIKYKNNNTLNNNIFEIYQSFQNNKFYIVIPNIIDFNIEVYYLNKTELEKYKILEGQKYEISFLKYYINKKNEEYLLSTDILEQIYIWYISHDFNIIQIIKTNYIFRMYSNILLFIENKNYIITTCFPKEEDINNNNIDIYSRIYLLEKGHFIKNIKGSNLNSTFSVLHWYNKNDNNDYIIECCIGKIFAYNLTKDEIYINYYDEFKEIYFFNGIIIL